MYTRISADTSTDASKLLLETCIRLHFRHFTFLSWLTREPGLNNVSRTLPETHFLPRHERHERFASIRARRDDSLRLGVRWPANR